MNYRHAFHAGNFADVVKHATLMRVLTYLRQKDAAFRVVDTHAGAGIYDLTSEEARRSGEWRHGIGRLVNAKPKPEIAALLAPYLDAVAAINSGVALKRYPGSPLLACAMLRPQDRLLACELEPGAAALLRRNLRDPRVTTMTTDGWAGLNASMPPKERRGLVLLDPPFEEPDEFETLSEVLAAACRKWPTGIYLAWYPLKDFRESEAFGRKLARLRIPKILRAEVTLPAVTEINRLRGTGLVVINPPWTLQSELSRLLPALGDILSEGAQSLIRLDWIAGEK